MTIDNQAFEVEDAVNESGVYSVHYKDGETVMGESIEIYLGWDEGVET